MLGGGVLAILFIIPLFSIFTSQTSIASEPSFIRNIEGSVAIQRDGVIFSPKENEELFNSDIIVTNKNSAVEIIFFEGTVLRMDENTHITIEKITPHPFLFSSGGITVHLETGKAWVTTFQKSSEGNGLILTTPNTVIYPEKSSFAAVYIEGRESILMFKNKGIVRLNGLLLEDNVEMKGGEMIQFTPFDRFTPLNEKIPEEWNIGWIAENKEKDKKYTTEYLERISTKMKEKYVLEELSNQVQLFLASDPDPDDVENLIRDINNLMLISNTRTFETEDFTESPTPLPSPTQKETPEIKIYKKNYNTSYSSKNIKKYSSETDENKNYRTEIIDENIENRIETASNEGALLNNENSENSENNFNDESFLTATEIAEQNRLREQEKKVNRAVQSFSEQVNAFQFENSRTTKAKNILDSIPVSGENLELLQEISKNSPEDVKGIVDEKLKKIEKKAKEEKEENIKKYKENLKHSAPLKSSQRKEKKSKNIIVNTSVENKKNKKNDVKIIETSVPLL